MIIKENLCFMINVRPEEEKEEICIAILSLFGLHIYHKGYNMFSV